MYPVYYYASPYRSFSGVPGAWQGTLPGTISGPDSQMGTFPPGQQGASPSAAPMAPPWSYPPGPFPGGGGPAPGGFPPPPPPAGGPAPGGFPPPPPPGGPAGGPPQGPPPSFTPTQATYGAGPGALAISPGSIQGCLYRYVYIWQNNGQSYWVYLTNVSRHSISGYRWLGFGPVGSWVYFGIDLNQISQFYCYG
ncbi:hypothetical protein [Paenibacillus thalictri]|uniref:Transporter n=1 Tax=Paenibacillus thalictri TaxID=2527873 RepID=A0A4Q9DFK5_9BACL|nr:hypothetical protein [Paenibacillus thalictri]TBL70770.1 hypothetical protein EYB31_32640 [Paenibacillus thalictri]